MHAVEETNHQGYPALTLRSPQALEATFAPGVGMVGCSLRHHGEELLGQRKGIARYEATGSTFGIPLLHPWANRLTGDAPVNRDSPLIRPDPNGLPIHGVLAASPHWRVTDTGADDSEARVIAALDFGAHPELLEAFPFRHELRMDVRLSDATLAITTTLRPTADTPVPVSFGYHPYFQLPNVPRAEWRLTNPAKHHLVLDERGIPTGETEAADEPPQRLGERTFDDAYGDLEPGEPFALEGGGRRIAVAFGEAYPFAQVYAPAGEDLIAIEPMTAPTNALGSGWQLPTTEPGGEFTAEFAIAVSDA